MRCPNCGCLDDKVIDTRISKEGDSIRRRRECLSCASRFTTRESVTRTEIVVVKRDGRREEFDPEKLRRGIELACWKRPVHEEQIERLVAEVTAKVYRLPDPEVSSLAVGEMVMERLQTLDDVAYVRFASVYRRFKDVDQFINEVQNLAEAQGVRAAEAGRSGT